MTRGLSDGNLQALWRKAGLIVHHNCCFVCGKPRQLTVLENHHYIPRNNLLTRYAWQNAFPACCTPDSYRKGMTCHQYLHTKAGDMLIKKWLDKNGWLEYLHDRETQSKQWFVEHGMTRNDYLKQMYDELKGIING